MKRLKKRTEDLSPAESALAELRVCRERLDSVIALSSDFYWEQDEDFRFTLVHHRDADESVRATSYLLGKTRWDLDATPVEGTWEEHRATLSARLPFDDFVTRWRDRDEERYLSSSGRPVFDPDGMFAGYRGVARDVTKGWRDKKLFDLERQVTAILAKGEEGSPTLRAAVQAICESQGWDSGQYWSVDQENNVIRFDVGWSIARDVIEEIAREARDLEITRGVGLVGIVWESGEPLWVPDLRNDRRLVRPDVPKRTGWNSALLFPVFSGDRLIGVLDFNAPTIPKPDDRLLQIVHVLGLQIGTYHERANAMKKLRESEDLYASTVELAAIRISHVGAGGQFLHVNRQFLEMLGYTREELLGLTVTDVSHPDDKFVTDEDQKRLHHGEIDSFKAEKRYLRKDGTPIWVRLTIAIRRKADGTPRYHVSVIEDISDRKRAEERVNYLATHDEMTGLPNRAMFSELLDHAILSARRHKRQCTVLFVDLDRFKIINDSLGHAAGDMLLKEVASRMRRSLRQSDLVARLGGDE